MRADILSTINVFIVNLKSFTNQILAIEFLILIILPKFMTYLKFKSLEYKIKDIILSLLK